MQPQAISNGSTRPDDSPLIRQVVYGGLVALAMLTPIIVTLLLLTASSYNLLDYMPTSSDEKFYWHQIATFKEAGFNGGYYSIDEVPAKASFSHFYTKGPLFPMFYGTLGQIFGWQHYSGGLFNMAILALSIGLFIYVTRPNTHQLLLMIALFATSWPMLAYLHDIMLDGLQAAIAVLMAAIFYAVLVKHENIPTYQVWILAAIILVLSLVRGITWTVLLLPLFLITARDKRLLSIIWQTAKAGVLMIIGVLAFQQITMPRALGISAAPVSTSGVNWRMLLDRISQNISFFNEAGPAIGVAQRYQIVGLSVFFGGAILADFWQQRRSLNNLFVDRSPQFWEAVFHICNLTSIFILQIGVYYVAQDLRIFAPPIILSMLLFIVFGRYRLAILIIVINLLFTPFFLETWAEYARDNYTYDESQITVVVEAFEDELVYEPSQENAWCNTLLFSELGMIFEMPVLAVPPGIGWTYTQSLDLVDRPLKSRYVLLAMDAIPPIPDDLEWIKRTPLGDLYLNPAAHCP